MLAETSSSRPTVPGGPPRSCGGGVRGLGRDFSSRRRFRGRPLVSPAAIILLVAGLLTGVVCLYPAPRQAALSLGYSVLSQTEAAWYLLRLGAQSTLVSHGFEMLLAPGQQSDVDYLGRPQVAPPLSVQAQWVASAAAEARALLPAATGLHDVPDRLPRIVLYPNAGEMSRLWGWPVARGAGGAYWPGALQTVAPGAWLACEPGGPSGEASLALLATVGHELTHWAYEEAAAGRLPRWLSEGLAQRAEERMLGSEAPTELVRARARSAGAAGIREFSKWFGVRAADPIHERRAYLLSRSLVSFLDLQCEPGWEQRLVGELRRAVSFERALRNAAGMTMADLEQEWREWVCR